MAKKNRTCLCCNTTYSYCPTCGTQDRLKPTWMTEFCSEECKNLWETATKYYMNLISKEKAKEIISGLSLKPHTEYVECVQRDLKNILKEEPKKEEKQFKMSKQKSHAVVEEK